MPDVTSLAVAVQPLLPLHIRAVEFQHPTLVVAGERWSLTLLGGWHWLRGGLIVTGWHHSAAEDLVWDLCGLELVGVRFPDPTFDGDCSFSLSLGSLEVRSDRSGYETWTFSHDDLDVVFVGV